MNTDKAQTHNNVNLVHQITSGEVKLESLSMEELSSVTKTVEQLKELNEYKEKVMPSNIEAMTQ